MIGNVIPYTLETCGDESGVVIDSLLRDKYDIQRKTNHETEPIYNLHGCKVKVFTDSPTGKIEIKCEELDDEKRAELIWELIDDINERTNLKFLIKP